MKITELNSDNLTLRNLKIDESFNPSQRRVEGANFSLVEPTPVDKPQLVAVSEDALALLDIDPQEARRPDFAEYFCGNKLLPGARPAAHCYCGYQFGLFSGQLGDGAAMYLMEVVNSRGQRWELQFKGAGLTPYSRSADGRKVLRSSIREFLCSEAMYYLGIPTTRAASVVTSDTRVVRDVHYTGNPIQERATVISRIAPTFLRFGSFEIFKPQDPTTSRSGSSPGREAEMLPAMLRHTISTYFPQLWSTHGGEQLLSTCPRGNEPGWHPLYVDWYREVVRRTASLVAAWQCVGWCHGVLNTDNMSIVGVTLDYGPFGFMDAFDPDFVCNGSDDSGRYSYAAQPAICRWNCEKLGEALEWAVPKSLTQPVLETFDEEYTRAYNQLMCHKLGLLAVSEPEDVPLVEELLKVMADTGADWTNTWRCLARFPMPPASTAAETHQEPLTGEVGLDDGGVLDYILEQTAELQHLVRMKAPRIHPAQLQMLLMLGSKDSNLLLQMGTNLQALQREQVRLKAAQELLKMKAEEKRAADREQWASWLRRYGQRLAREAAAGADPEQRVRVMNSTNPRFVLRNWIAQSAIEKAENGDFSEVNTLLELLKRPFTDEDELHAEQQATATAAEARRHAPGGLPQDTHASTSISTASAPGQSSVAAGGGVSAPLGAGTPSEPAAAAAAAEASGHVCRVNPQLWRELLKQYGGKPPAWAKELCVTCSS